MILLAGPAFASEAEGKSIETKDADGDGRVDYWAHYENGRRTRSETDTNGDGTPDFWRFFEQGPEVVLDEKDLNFDGRVDERKSMVWGFDRNVGAHAYRTAWIEADRDFDGLIDDFWVSGSLRSRTRDKKGESMRAAYKTNVPKTLTGSWTSPEDVVRGRDDFEHLVRGESAGDKKE